MQTQVFTMTRNGGMEVNNGRPELPIGCKLYTYGAGMSECDAVVIGAPDQYGAQKYVTISRYEDSQRFGIIEKYARPISKKFGIGCYYDDAMEVSYTAEEIEQAIQKATQAQANRDATAKAEADAHAAAKAAMPELHPYLKPLDGSRWDNKNYKAERKANLVAALRHNFPGIFFSVRNDHGSTYYIRWENGPCEKAVDEVVNQFKDSYFDGMTDSTVHYKNAFAEVFGSFDYLFTHRDMSKEVAEIIEGNKHLNGDSGRDPFSDAWRKQSFPAAATVTGFDDDAYVFTFTTPEKVAEAEGTTGSLTIKHYSEKSFIVEGDTYPIREQMKSLGGVWLRNVKAWCYSYRKLEDVKAALGIVG